MARLGLEDLLPTSLMQLLGGGFSWSTRGPLCGLAHDLVAVSFWVSAPTESGRVKTKHQCLKTSFWKWSPINSAVSSWSYRTTLEQCGRGPHCVWIPEGGLQGAVLRAGRCRGLCKTLSPPLRWFPEWRMTCVFQNPSWFPPHSIMKNTCEVIFSSPSLLDQLVVFGWPHWLLWLDK